MKPVPAFSAIVLCTLSLAACFRPPQVTPPPEANFAAHVDHRGLVVDRMRGSDTAGDAPTIASARAATDKVHPAWDDRDAVRFNVMSNGQSFEIGPFKRIGGPPSPSAIGESASMTTDVRGTYLAEVRDATGAPVGWLRVEVAPRGSAVTRTFDGDLPPALNGPVAVAVIAEVNSEISAMRRYATDPYLGN